MAKSNLEKEMEKQRKAQEKMAKEAHNREVANSIVSSSKYINGFRVMDKESEDLLYEILKQYDGNSNNYVNFDITHLPRPLKNSISVGYEKLQLYGVISSVNQYMSGAMITLSDTGKNYFEDKPKSENSIVINHTSRKQYDVFISHARKDKNDYVNELNEAVKKLGISIFYDTDVISWGDNWKQVILNGTKSSEFAIIVISNNFFDREWTEKELNEFLIQQNENQQKTVLPLLYGITLDELKAHYPELGDIQCLSTSDFDIDDIVILLAKELIKRYK